MWQSTGINFRPFIVPQQLVKIFQRHLTEVILPDSLTCLCRLHNDSAGGSKWNNLNSYCLAERTEMSVVTDCIGIYIDNLFIDAKLYSFLLFFRYYK